MSYILDALKRAEAERGRGQVPGLHSQSPSALATPSGEWSPRHRALTVATGLGALLVVAGLSAWWWMDGRAPAPSPDNTLPVPAAAPTPQERPTTPPVVAEAPAATAAPVLPILAPVPQPAPVAVREPAASGARPASTGEPPAAPQADAKAATPAKGEVRSFAALPPEVRAQLPQVNVSGSTYSSNPVHRMLIVNGQVLQEGAEIAPGLQLETIGPRSAVLNHRGMRYSIGY